MERIHKITKQLTTINDDDSNLIKSYYLCPEDKLKIQEYRNGCRKIILNRVKALNSLDYTMLPEILRLLLEYRDDKEVTAVILCSASDRAYCSGGDLKEFIRLSNEDPNGLNEFIRCEYTINHLIHTFTNKPLISVVDGIVMGGGVGISIHCGYRICTERSLWAMPECQIGYFPDVGTTYQMSRLKSIGLFLSLTGSRIKSNDMIHLNIATHFIHSKNLNNLLNEIISSNNINSTIINNILNEYSLKENINTDMGNNNIIVKYKDIIEKCFNWNFESLNEIYKCLNQELNNTQDNKKDWIGSIISILDNSCPTSLLVTFSSLHKAINLSIEDCIINEIRIGSRIGIRPDLNTGVSKVLLKSAPISNFSPSPFQCISKEFIESFFLPLDNSNQELQYDPRNKRMISQ